MFITISGTAVNTSDYTITSAALLGSVNFNSFSVRIPAGQTSATVTITPIADGTTEGSETVILTSEGDDATVTIVDAFASLTFPVTTTANSGAGLAAPGDSGRQRRPGRDLITFAIPGAGQHTIAPQSPLPALPTR